MTNPEIGVSAQLSVRGGRAAIAFYRAAFGAVELYRVGGTDEDESVVAQLAVGGSSFWVADESPANLNFSPETLGGGTVRMLLRRPGPGRGDRPGRRGRARGWSTRRRTNTAGDSAGSRTRSVTTGKSAHPRFPLGRRLPDPTDHPTHTDTLTPH